MTQIRNLSYSYDADMNDWDNNSILEATEHQNNFQAAPPCEISWIERVAGMVDTMTVCCSSPISVARNPTVDSRQDIFRKASKSINMKRCNNRTNYIIDNLLNNSTNGKLNLRKSHPIPMSPPPLSKATVFSEITQKGQNNSIGLSSTPVLARPVLTRCETASTASMSIPDTESNDDNDDFSVDSSRTVTIQASLLEDDEEWDQEHCDDSDKDASDSDDAVILDLNHVYLMKKKNSAAQNVGDLKKCVQPVVTSPSESSFDAKYELPRIYSRDCLDHRVH